MTADEFRRLALSFPGASERSHQGHPDFRANGKVFATLGYPDEAWGMVKLPPSEQVRLLESRPKVFTPSAGKWGAGGSTLVNLAQATERVLRPVMTLAWKRVQPPGP